jgi:hypothetical protein
MELPRTQRAAGPARQAWTASPPSRDSKSERRTAASDRHPSRPDVVFGRVG